MRVLIVEDEFTSRALLLRMLERLGAACDVAVNGTEALSAFKLGQGSGNPYDLVCLDIGLPVVCGQTVLKQIREHEEEQGVGLGQGAVVFMTTGARDGKNVMKSFFGGCQAYLVKPLNRDQLYEELTKNQLMAADQIAASTGG